MIPAIWTSMFAELALPEALRVLHACGWAAFEVSTEHLVAIEQDKSPESRIEEVCACAKSLGVRLPQAHALLKADVAALDKTERERDLQRLMKHMDIAARLGVRVVVVHPGGKHGFTSRSERRRILEDNAASFKKLGDHAGERGLRIGIENVCRRGGATPGELLELVDAADHPVLGVTLDTSHAQVAGLNLPAAIADIGSHLVGTHISDSDGSADQHLTPGGGTIDWPAVMHSLKAAHYEGLFNLENPGERHPVVALRKMKTRFACSVTEWLLSLT